MTTRPTPIFASDKTAAELLDMKPAEFLRLVEGGHLPKGREIAPGVLRWTTDDLRRIARGDASEGMGDVQW